MAVIVQTSNTIQLVESLHQRIIDNNITTWLLDDDGDITIRNPMWRQKAWFKIIKDPTRIVFGIIPSMKYAMTKELYGVYHGRIAATLLANFDDIIDSIELTSGYLDDYDVTPIMSTIF